MVIKSFLRAVSSAFLLVFIGIETAVAAVGVTSGNFDVNPQGAASYNIPISVPPGTAGMEPKLSLRYTSGGGNGLIGVGWSLAGLSSIGRCPATYAQDGFIDGVNFDADDRLCLDGARLVAVSGTYGQNGTEYRTEIEQFVKVRQNGGNLNSGNVWFQVWTKSGLVQEYGRDGNAAFTVPGKGYTQLWSVNRIADTVGNYIDVDYAFDSTNNEHYVERIDYTGNDQAGQPPYNSVRFEYTQTRPDKGSGYTAGGSDKMVSSRRLSSIKTYVQSSVVRKYNLSYTTGTTSGRSLLSGLQECAYGTSGPADCLPQMTFNWTQTTPGFSTYAALVPPFNLRLSDGRQRGKAIDIDGDGRTDFVRANGSNRKTWLNTVSGGQQSWQVDSAYKLPKPLFKDTGERRALLVDVNGDGLPDLVQGFSASNQRTYLNTGSGWQMDDAYRLPKRLFDGESRPEGILVDVNSDGLQDLIISTRDVEYEVNGSGEITDIWIESETNETYLNQSSSCSGVACRWQRSTAYDLPNEAMFAITRSQYAQGSDGELFTRGKFSDLNGDGLLDYTYVRSFPPDFAGTLVMPPSEAVMNTGSGWSSSTPINMPAPTGQYVMSVAGSGVMTNPAELIDVNGDGLTDVVCSTYAMTINYDMSQAPVCGPNTTTTLIQDLGFWKTYYARATYINTGDGFQHDATYNLPAAFFVKLGNIDPRGALFHDLTDDGRPEFIRAHEDETRETYINNYASQCATEGCKWQFDATYQLPFDYFEAFDARIRGAVNHFDMDGRIDFVASAEGITNAVYVTNGNQANGDRPDLLKGIDPGDFGSDIEIEYTTLLDPAHFTLGTAAYPQPSVTGSQSVVRRSKRVAANTTSTTYQYRDLRVDALGRGGLGFAEFEAENEQSGIRELIEYEQGFPYTGMTLSVTRSAPHPVSGRNTLTRTINTLATKQLGSGSAERQFPYVATADKQFFDLANNATPLTTNRTETVYDDYGNATQVTQKRFQGSSPGVDLHTSITTSQYTNDINQWLLGRLTHATVVKSNPYSTSVTRETGFEYDAVTGLLTAEIVEPNDASLRKRTEYQYDAFGNQTLVTTSGVDIVTRSTATTWDTKGQFKTSVTNALGHSETHGYSPRHGGQTTLTGPNSLTTTWEYDAFGRRTKQTAPDGTTVVTSYEDCGVSCPVAAGALLIRTTKSDGAEAIEVFDHQERQVLASSKGYDGTWIDVVTQYDDRDRKVAETAPHYRNGGQHWTTQEYDDHDRVVRTESPLNDSTAGGIVTQIVYDGLITRQTDPNGKLTEKHHDAAGNTTQVVDALSGTTDFEYDPYGNRIQVTDASSNVTTIQFDKLGRKVAMSDPDMGDWTYAYNVLGELVSQTDAKTQTVTMTYDELGRMTQRSEAEGTSTWSYDSGWIGSVDTETAPGGFQRDYIYDSLGRVSDVATVIGSQTYTVSRTYDGQSRLDKLTYPSGLAVRHNYTATGYLEEVVHDVSGLVYWHLDHRDAFGNAEMESLGNGHSTVRNHDNARNYVDSIMTGDIMGTEIQSLTYTWGKVGNLASRTDQKQGGLTEAFEYDDLYRLTGSTLNGNGNLSVSYDAIGNITSKSGVGSYTYGAGSAGPHALTQVTGSRPATYTYDANGNMLQGAGRSVAWTSFNKPATITRGNAYSAFQYGPDRARYKHQRDRDEGGQLVSTTIHYVGALYERHFEGTGFEDKHFIRADGRTIAIEIVRSDTTAETLYLHRDHLGSVDAITDAGGNLEERYSYDAFGKRRQLPWTPDTADVLLYSTIQIEERGYTGHEQLDHVGLIHMNGRVYDPIVGRFASPDPFVQFPESTQGLNRYTYVNNSPLSYTDPSGFFSFGDLFKALINPAILVNEYIIENPRESLAIGLMVVPGGQILGVQSALAGFAVATAQGFAAGMVAGRGDLRAGLMGAATAGAFYGVGSAFESQMVRGWVGEAGSTGYIAAKTITHGAVGGAASDWYGGSFSDGFLGAAAGQAFGAVAMKNVTDRALRVGTAALVGGTATHIGGGKFANGAITAAFGQAFNDAGHGAKRRAYRESLAARGSQELPSLAPGQYQVAIDALSVSLGPVAIEAGDLWLYNPVDDRILQFRYTAVGAGVGIGSSFSRQYGFISISSVNDLIGVSTSFSTDGVVGLGGAASFYSGVSTFSPGSAGGLSVGLHGGFSWTGARVHFNKSYAKEEAPMIGVPW